MDQEALPVLLWTRTGRQVDSSHLPVWLTLPSQLKASFLILDNAIGERRPVVGRGL
jgi:hypothetical protein